MSAAHPQNETDLAARIAALQAEIRALRVEQAQTLLPADWRDQARAALEEALAEAAEDPDTDGRQGARHVNFGGETNLYVRFRLPPATPIEAEVSQ